MDPQIVARFAVVSRGLDNVNVPQNIHIAAIGWAPPE
jgi:hypothetical protein